jgi:hypothetical protein
MVAVPVVVGLLAPTIGQKADAAGPAGKAHKVEPIPGSTLKRVILTPKAAERLGIETGAVSEQAVVRNRTFLGQIVPGRSDVTLAAATAGGAAATGEVTVRVPVIGDVTQVARDRPGRVLPLHAKAALPAKPIEVKADADPDAGKALYYAVEGAPPGLSPGQPVTVELPLNGSGTKQPVVPYSAVVYDEQGRAWIFTNPAPLIFVREPVIVDYFDGDTAVLSKGPAAGTKIVTVGVSQLFGAETGVGH